MAVVPNGLHVEEETDQEADENGEELDRVTESAAIAVDEEGGAVGGFAGHQHGYKGA